MADQYEPVPIEGQAAEQYEPVPLSRNPFADEAIDKVPLPVPFLNRLRVGSKATHILQEALAGAKEGFGEESTPTGLSDDTLNYLIKTGVFHDPATRSPSMLQFLAETGAMSGVKAWEALGRSISAGFHAGGAALAQLQEEVGLGQGLSVTDPFFGTGQYGIGSSKSLKNDVVNAGNWAMIEAGMGRFSRPGIPSEAKVGAVPANADVAQIQRVLDRAVHDEVVGGIPTDQDFRIAAENIAGRTLELVTPRLETEGGARVYEPGELKLNPNTVEKNLRDLWEEKGVTPAEAAEDAKNDAFVKQELTSEPENETDRSGLPPVTGPSNLMPEGTPQSQLALTGEKHIDLVLNDPVTRKNIDNAVVVDIYDIPYAAGGSNDLSNPVFFIDKDMPRSLTIDNVTFDPARPFIVHDNVEQHVMEFLTARGWSAERAYAVAHWGWAEPAEHAWYRAHGIDPAKAEAAYKPITDAIQRKEGPLNLPPKGQLYEPEYPNGDPRLARSEKETTTPKPSAADLAEAKKIILDEHEFKSPVEKTPEETKAQNEKIAAKHVSGKKRGRAAADPDTFSLLEFLASRGGIRGSDPKISDLQAILGKPNKLIPSFGNLIRKQGGPLDKPRGMTLDGAREAAVEAGYIQAAQEDTTINTLLEHIEREVRGEKVYRQGIEAKADQSKILDEAERLFDQHMEDAGVPPREIPDNIRKRALEMMTKEGVSDPVDAYEKAEFELAHDAAEKGEAARIAEEVPGFDVPPDTGAVGETRALGEGEPPGPGGEVLPPSGSDTPEIEGEGRPFPLSAAASPPGELPSFAAQPPPRPGRLVQKATNTVSQLFGLARNIQGILDPMATGSMRAMALAKDVVGLVNRIRWEHMRTDMELLRRFTPERRKRMWEAIDEQSVLEQEIAEQPSLAAQRENMGLVTLDAEERAMAEQLMAHSRAAWNAAVNTGMVEGEGLPYYITRMVANVATSMGDVGPQVLNQLGRNVFTRTSQMMRRKYLLAEETEAAAKELVARRMAERGASQAEIVEALDKIHVIRDVRVLPLATARLEEATVYRQMINDIERWGHETGNETVAHAPTEGYFTIAGNPAFSRWRPDYLKDEHGNIKLDENGRVQVRKDQDGNVVMKNEPIHISNEFRGPAMAIMGPEVGTTSKVVPGAPSAYGALMTLKGKSMTVILNSPLVHFMVVMSKVAEAAPSQALGFKFLWTGNRLVNGNPARASELIERGLTPMGRRGSFQDITSSMEQVSLEPHQSWTGQLLALVPGIFSEGAEQAVIRRVAWVGDKWHNFLLWDRVRDVQFGLADWLSNHFVDQGVDRLTADRIASHTANMVVGAMPKEAMGAGARAFANLLLFSRSFTLGNLSIYKQAVAGIPKPILAQIARDHGVTLTLEPGEYSEMFEGVAQQAKQTAQYIARRKAIVTIGLSIGTYYIGNAILQHMANLFLNNHTVDDEARGYVRRATELAEDVKKDPWELRHVISRMSPTADNEPGKEDRIHWGYDKNGTAVYGRNIFGKYGEELLGAPTKPMTMLRQKLNPMVGSLLDILTNDKGFGHHVYDESDQSVGASAFAVWRAMKHIVMKELPEQQIQGAWDMLHGDGDQKVNAARTFGPVFGMTPSVGATSPEKGVYWHNRKGVEMRFDLQWPDIRKEIRRGNVEGAREALRELGWNARGTESLIKNAQDPQSALTGRQLREFYQSAPEAEIRRYERFRDERINRGAQ